MINSIGIAVATRRHFCGTALVSMEPSGCVAFIVQ
jgi:hypothetical protein